MRLNILPVLLTLLFQGCSATCFDGEFDQAMPVKNVSNKDTFFSVLERRSVAYVVEDLELSDARQTYLCTRALDDQFVLEALAIARGSPSPIEYTWVGYGDIDDHQAYLRALATAAIHYELTDDDYPPRVWTKKDDGQKVSAIQATLFGTPPTELHIGVHEQRAFHIHKRLQELGISTSLTTYHGDHFVTWGKEANQRVQEILKDEFDTDVEDMHAQTRDQL